MRPVSSAKALILLAGLAACQPATLAAPPHLRVSGFGLDAAGLQPEGTDLRVDFGRAQTGVIESVTRLLSEPPARVAPVAGCAGGPVVAADWPRLGLRLMFRAGDFLGWAADDPALAAGALRPGMAHSELPPVTFTETPLGTEFRLDGVQGVLTPDGTELARIWSGLACNPS